MKKNYFGILLLLIASGATWASNEVIVDKQGLGVGKTDIDMLLKPAPVKVQLEVLKRKTDLAEKLQELYLAKAVSAEVKKKPLTAEEQFELDETLKMFYFNLKLKQLSEQGLPDFEPLAALEYKGHKDKYVEPEQVAIEHILIDNHAKRSDKDAFKLANDIIAQLKKGGDFGVLALKYSDDPASKQNKGQLGFFPKGKMLKAFEDAAYQLKLNEVSSSPVETKYGYHVLRKYGQKPSAQKTYEAAKEEIIARLKGEYVQNRLTDYYAKIKKDNGMTVDEKALDAYIAEKTKVLEAESKSSSAAVK